MQPKNESKWLKEGGADMLRTLSKKWKTLLKYSDSKLRIDAEFTRPGVICLLTILKDNLKKIRRKKSTLKKKFSFTFK